MPVNQLHPKLTAARVSLVLDQPFFGALAMGLNFKADPSCKTAWINGRDLGYNAQFIDSLNHDQVTALLAHEIMHCACGHPWRRDGRDLGRWNVACDKAINENLREAGFRLPDGVLFPQGEECGKSAEWIFGRLPDPSQNDQESDPDEENENDQDGDQGGAGESGQDGDQDGDGQGDQDGDPLGEVRDAPTDPDQDGQPAPTEEEWKQRTAEAAQQAKLQGKMGAGLARQISEALKPRIDVRSLLLRFFQDRAAADYSWAQPNKSYLAQGLYLPALQSHALGEVAIMVDTSGSVDEVSLSYARAIVESVIDECSPTAVTVYYADAQVCRVDRFERGESLTWAPAGGGGTDFRPALQAIEQDGTAICALCITDLYGAFPQQAPDLPVLWLATTNQIAPFGETIALDQ
jgi:predicted metal-dependent peptidase